MGFIFRDSNVEMIRVINEAFIKRFSDNFNNSNNVDFIASVVKRMIRETIIHTKTWKALSNGGVKGLDAHFGIPSKELDSRLNTILDIWSQEIIVKPAQIKRRNRTFIFAYKFYAIESDWHNVLASDAGVTTNNSRRAKKGEAAEKLPWLEWLLTEGDQLKIDGYHIDYGNYKRSRSGKAFMRPKLSWRIPTGYGPFSSNNNFVTRALHELATDEEFRKRLNNIIKNIIKGNSTNKQL